MRSISFILFPEFQIVDLNAISAFKLANDISGEELYEIEVVSIAGGNVSSCLALSLSTAKVGDSYDTAIFIGSTKPVEADPDAVEVVRRVSRNCRRMAASGTATFLFASAGLLDGRRATTHWAFAPDLQRLHPQVHVEADRIHVNDGGVWTSAGMSAVLDLALALIEEDLGVGAAAEVARRLVLAQRRAGAQPQISTLLDLDPNTDRIRKVLAYAHANLRGDLSVEKLADVANLSPRQFSRLFRQETGRSPAKAVEAMRIEAARVMLDGGRLPLSAVARNVGFADADAMRRVFARAACQSPWVLREQRTMPRFMPIIGQAPVAIHLS